MRLLNSSLMGNYEQLAVPAENEFYIFGSKTDDCSVVDYDVRQKRVCMDVGVFDVFLVKLQLRHTEPAKDHKW